MIIQTEINNCMTDSKNHDVSRLTLGCGCIWEGNVAKLLEEHVF